MSISETARTSFYKAALGGLRFLDTTGQRRRFGADADAHWQSFAGHLGIRDRIDFLLRDAAVSWDAAFSPARVFLLPGLAPDEPFGPDWTSLAEDAARKLWKAADGTPGDFDTTFAGLLDALGLQPLAPAPDVGSVLPATRLLVHGASAIVATAKTFHQSSELSWSDQVLVLADDPAERHLAGMVAVLIAARAPSKLLTTAQLAAGDVRATLRAVGMSTLDRAVVTGTPAAATAAAIQRVLG